MHGVCMCMYMHTNIFLSCPPPLSFGVVLWEMVTGERPYGGLNLYVVAFGVGNGTLSLPIPGGCPDPLVDLMKGRYCIHREMVVVGVSVSCVHGALWLCCMSACASACCHGTLLSCMLA